MMKTRMLLSVIGLGAACAGGGGMTGAAASGPGDEGSGAFEPRHPIITEVLYRVPTFNGDANRDGSRHPTGDEFIELANPWQEPIQLEGYELTDRNAADMGRMRFVFPALELGPGEVVVVFNGLEQEWVGPVGDTHRAPPGTHARFADAWVLTMANESEMTGLGNSGDWVLLRSPAGEPLSCVTWGRTSRSPPAGGDRLEVVPEVRAASVQRDPETGRFEPHPEAGEFRFSPGAWAPGPGFDPARMGG